MLPEFMNLLRKFYFMRAVAQSTRVEMLLFRQTERDAFASLSLSKKVTNRWPFSRKGGENMVE